MQHSFTFTFVQVTFMTSRQELDWAYYTAPGGCMGQCKYIGQRMMLKRVNSRLPITIKNPLTYI